MKPKKYSLSQSSSNIKVWAREFKKLKGKRDKDVLGSIKK
jgi:hypothetical protein